MTFHESYPSPDGSLVADWYKVTGGTDVRWTAGYVRLRRATDLFAPSNDDVFQGPDVKLTVVWKGNAQLEIAYPRDTMPARAYEKWNGVSISYRAER